MPIRLIFSILFYIATFVTESKDKLWKYEFCKILFILIILFTLDIISTKYTEQIGINKTF